MERTVSMRPSYKKLANRPRNNLDQDPPQAREGLHPNPVIVTHLATVILKRLKSMVAVLRHLPTKLTRATSRLHKLTCPKPFAKQRL